MLPGNFEVVRCQSCNFMHFGEQSFTENEYFMFIKLNVASSAVSPFKIRLSPNVLLHCVQILITVTGGYFDFTEGITLPYNSEC